MNKWILTVVLFVGLMGKAWSQEVEVSAAVVDKTVSVGKPFNLDLTLKVPYGYYVEWNDFATDTLSEQIDIWKRGQVERTADADSNIIVRQTLSLMTFDTGYVQVPSVGLAYAKNADDPMRMRAYTDPISLQVNTIAVDTIQPFRPIVEPITQPLSMKDMFPWLLGALLLVLLGFGVWFLLRHRKPTVDAHGEPVKGPVKPPYNKAIDDLTALRQQKLWQAGKVKEYYASLSDITREYIEGQFQVNAVEMTTEDILDEVRDLNFSSQVYGKLKQSMELSDLVKFAKYTASSLENDNAMTDVTDFVNESYAHYQKLKAQEAEATGKEAHDHV